LLRHGPQSRFVASCRVFRRKPAAGRALSCVPAAADPPGPWSSGPV